MRSKSIYRKIRNNCGPFENVQFHFLNSIGGTESWTFTKEKKERLSSQRFDFERQLDFEYNIGDRGKTIYSQTVIRSGSVKSDWLSEYEYHWLDNLFKSTQVFMVEGMDLIPINLNAPEWEYKYIRLDKIFQAEIEWEIANKLNVDGL